MEVKCEFASFDNKYCCYVTNQRINFEVELEFRGEHEPDKKNEDVSILYIYDGLVLKIPRGLTKTFPNLETIDIRKSHLKVLKKEHLAEYKDIKEFKAYMNDIEYLEGDIFDGFKNLQKIDFSNNIIEIIEPNILDGLDKLLYVNFRENPHYKHIYYAADSEPTMDIEELKETLWEKFPHANYKSLFNKMRKSIQKLKTEHDLRENEISELKTFNENYAIEVQRLQKNFQQEISIKKAIQHDQKFHDFLVKVDGRRFYFHKVFLAARSPLLAEMLNANPNAKVITLVDISGEIFEKIYDYIYLDQLPEDNGLTSFLHLFVAAGTLKMEEIKNYAATKIYRQIIIENAVDMLELGNKYEHDGLRMKAFQVIKEKYPSVEFSDEMARDVRKVKEIVDILNKKARTDKRWTSRLMNMLRN